MYRYLPPVFGWQRLSRLAHLQGIDHDESREKGHVECQQWRAGEEGYRPPPSGVSKMQHSRYAGDHKEPGQKLKKGKGAREKRKEKRALKEAAGASIR